MWYIIQTELLLHFSNDTQFFQHHLLKDCPFSTELLLHHCKTAIDQMCGSISVLSVLFCGSICLVANATIPVSLQLYNKPGCQALWVLQFCFFFLMLILLFQICCTSMCILESVSSCQWKVCWDFKLDYIEFINQFGCLHNVEPFNSLTKCVSVLL